MSKMVSEYNKNLSIKSGMPNLVGKVTSFAFLSTFVSREVTFSGFQYSVGNHFGPPFEFESQDRLKIIIMNTIISDLPSQN